mgnify:FL=1
MFIDFRPVDVIGSDDPVTIHLAFDASARAPHGFESTHMCLSEGLRRRRVMTEMQVNRITSPVRRRDVGNSAINLPRRGAVRGDTHDGSFWCWLRGIAAPDIDIMDPTINAIDHQIMAIAMLVGKTAMDDAPDDRRGIATGNHLIHARTVQSSLCQFALHRTDDVAALTHAPERLLQSVSKLVASSAYVAGQFHLCKLAQPSHLNRLLERVAIGRGDDAIIIHAPQQAAIDRGQSFLPNIMAQPLFDFMGGARSEIERHQLSRTLAQTMGYILSGNDKVLARVIDAAQHDVGVRTFGVVVVDRHPVEFGAEICFDLRHQAANIGFEIGIFGTVFGGDNEAKLVAITCRAFEKCLAVGLIVAGRI